MIVLSGMEANGWQAVFQNLPQALTKLKRSWKNFLRLRLEQATNYHYDRSQPYRPRAMPISLIYRL